MLHQNFTASESYTRVFFHKQTLLLLHSFVQMSIQQVFTERLTVVAQLPSPHAVYFSSYGTWAKPIIFSDQQDTGEVMCSI